MNRKILNGRTCLRLLTTFFVIAMSIGTVPVSAKSKKPAKPNISVSACVPGDSVNISIYETSGADGYKIVMKAPGEKKYKKIETLRKDGTSVRSYTIKGLTDGKYSFKVRAYSKSGKKTVWGSYSKAKTITIENIKSEPIVITSLANAKSGDFVTFGHYEQDNNISNGTEPIEWLVLSSNGSELYVLSKYALDTKEYHSELSATWETCSLRTWLNEDFYNEAFNEEERKMVKTTLLENEDNPQYGTDGGKDTKDKVFLPSVADMENSNYGFSEFGDRQCIATAYASVQAEGKNIYGTSEAWGPCLWWLRTIGQSNQCNACIVGNGLTVLEGDVHIMMNGIRPAMILDITDIKKVETSSDDNSSSAGDNSLTDKHENDIAEEGEIITFGSYEQDGNIANGKEPIEWIVLSKDKNHMLVLSKDIIERRGFNENREATTWENSSIRDWLNTDFYNDAFSSDEKLKIEENIIENQPNPETKTDCGKNTKDKIFLLSLQEVTSKKYGFETDYNIADNKRLCNITDFAKSNVMGSHLTNDMLADKKFQCRFWLLRTVSGFSDEPEGVCAVLLTGETTFYAACPMNDAFNGGIRPAMYIQIK